MRTRFVDAIEVHLRLPTLQPAPRHILIVEVSGQHGVVALVPGKLGFLRRDLLLHRLGLQHLDPVERGVGIEAFSGKQFLEQPPEVVVVRLVLEPERAAVVQIRGKLHRVPLAQRLHCGGHLGLHDAMILLVLRLRLEALPRQRASQKIHQAVADGLQVVPAGLLKAQMGVDGRVACSSRQVLVLLVRDVLMRPRVSELFRQPKINQVHNRGFLARTHKEIVWLNVPRIYQSNEGGNGTYR